LSVARTVGVIRAFCALNEPGVFTLERLLAQVHLVLVWGDGGVRVAMRFVFRCLITFRQTFPHASWRLAAGRRAAEARLSIVVSRPARSLYIFKSLASACHILPSVDDVIDQSEAHQLVAR